MADLPPKKTKKTTVLTPDTMGAIKRHPIHMSLDELIDYRSTGQKPNILVDPDTIYAMAKHAISMKNICQMIGMSEPAFCANAPYLSAFQQGRGDFASKNRAVIAKRAAEGDIEAQYYLDRRLAGDAEESNTNISMTLGPPKEVLEAKTTDLLAALKLENKNND